MGERFRPPTDYYQSVNAFATNSFGNGLVIRLTIGTMINGATIATAPATGIAGSLAEIPGSPRNQHKIKFTAYEPTMPAIAPARVVLRQHKSPRKHALAKRHQFHDKRDFA